MTPSIQTWNVPNRILFGHGAAAQCGTILSELDAQAPLVITDEGVRNAGVLDPVLQSLSDANKDYTIFEGVQADPTETIVHEAADTYKQSNADAIVGIGGGSSIDTAKGASILATNPGDILKYTGSGLVERPTPPTVYLPTTAGSGSEVGHWCIVTDSERNIKEEIGDMHLLADAAIVDPALTETVPRNVKAATGMDVLTHAIEAYVSINAQSPTSALARDAVDKVGNHLPSMVGQRNTDREAHAKMARASMQAGMAFNGAGLGAVHALSHQVGPAFGVPHGLTNAIILPYVMEYNRPQIPQKLVTVAEILGESIDPDEPVRREAYKAVRATRELAANVRIPKTLGDTPVDRDTIPELAANALEDGSLNGNPRVTNQEDLEGILERAFDGEFEYETIL